MKLQKLVLTELYSELEYLWNKHKLPPNAKSQLLEVLDGVSKKRRAVVLGKLV
jgi:hypothetical protein